MANTNINKLNIDKEVKTVKEEPSFTFNDQCNFVGTIFQIDIFRVDKRPWKRLNEREVVAGRAEDAAPACKRGKMGNVRALVTLR